MTTENWRSQLKYIKTFSAIKICLHFGNVGQRRVFTLSGTSNENLYLLPDGQEVYIAQSVREFMSPNDFNNVYDLNLEYFDLFIQMVDNAPNANKMMVPIKRVGKGPTEKSAKFAVEVIQKVIDHETRNDVEKVNSIEFTLPVSQVEEMGEGQLPSRPSSDKGDKASKLKRRLS